MTPTTIRLTVNGQAHEIDVDADTALLYVLRNDLGLNGPKFGCGLGECGTCTVDEDCHGNDVCVLAVDGNKRCFDRDDATCTLDRVEVGRAPTPVPTATPSDGHP